MQFVMLAHGEGPPIAGIVTLVHLKAGSVILYAPPVMQANSPPSIMVL